MACSVILILVSLVLSTEAAGCLEGQQCSDCNRKTGYCTTKCFNGYFDLKCKSHCNKRCVDGVCESTQKGIERCSEGCVPGYQGIDCARPCGSRAVGCTKCKTMCDQGYCQLGSSCVSGCVDGYYGSDCNNCSSRCKTCNRITGTCEACEEPYLGPQCQSSRTCDDWCFEGCGREVSGNFCVEECDDNCRPAPNINDTTRCLGPGANTSVVCTSECHNQSGECLHGCVGGWYGPRCSSPCSAGCSGGRCDAAGACVDGCRAGFFGRDCEPCLDRCNNHTCNPHNGTCGGGCITGYFAEFCNETCEMCRDGVCDQMSGTCIKGCIRGYSGNICNETCEMCRDGVCDQVSGTCIKGCIRGYSGKICNETCEMCRDGVCDQMSGTCINGCDVSGRGCEPSCSSNCSREYCSGETCTDMRVSGISVGIPTGCVLLILAILVSNYVCYRKGRSANRDDLMNVDRSPAVEYQSWHNYYDIEEGDMDAEEPTEDLENQEEELALAMPVIAEVFQPVPAVVHRDDDTSSESPASSTSQSYTHLIPELVSGDPGTVDSYISPVEE